MRTAAPRLALAAWVSVSIMGPAVAQTAIVDDDTCPGVGMGTEADPYCRIQTAICALDAMGGGTVEVRPGTYLEAIRIFPGISVESSDGPGVTTIDAGGQPCIDATCAPTTTTTCSAVTFHPGVSTLDRLNGLRITGGGGTDIDSETGPSTVGAGIYVIDGSPTITQNVIVENVTSGSKLRQVGGGIFLSGGSAAAPTQPILTDNLIEGNLASAPGPLGDDEPPFPGFPSSVGGGLAIDRYAAPLVEGNTIRLNATSPAAISSGGGMVVYGFSSVLTPRITRNLISGNVSQDFGGGVSFSYGYIQGEFVPSRGRFDNNVVEANQSAIGGGMAMATTRVELFNNTIVENSAFSRGGGIAFIGTRSADDNANPVNNLIAFNLASSGGGIFIDLRPPAEVSTPTLANNLLFGNAPTQANVGTILGVDGNFQANPQLVSLAPGTRDLSLQPGSPAVDAGDTSIASATDFPGNPRVVGPQVDIGAFELQIAAPDFDNDGVPDSADNCPLDPNGSQFDNDGDEVGDVCDNCPLTPNPNQVDTNFNGVGDACEVDSDGDRVEDADDCAPLQAGISTLPAPVGATLALEHLGAATTLTWQRGSQAAVFSVYRGTVAGGPFEFTHVCREPEMPHPFASDETLPAPGELAYFLIESVNVCGSGGAGVTSAGTSRPLAPPCPPQSLDTDGDSVLDVADNCPTEANADQADGDGDFIGDACEP